MFLDFGSAGQAATGCDEASFTRHGTCRFRTYLLDFQASSASVRCCRLPSLRWRRLDDSQFEIANSPTDVVAGDDHGSAVSGPPESAIAKEVDDARNSPR